MLLAEKVVEHLLVAFRHVFEGQAELLRIADHRLVASVDELAAALDHLTREHDGTREGTAQREAAAACPVACLVDRREHPVLAKLVTAGKSGEARTDDRHVAAWRPRRRKRRAEWPDRGADRSQSGESCGSGQKLSASCRTLHRRGPAGHPTIEPVERREAVAVATAGDADGPGQAVKRRRSSHGLLPPRRRVARLSPAEVLEVTRGPDPPGAAATAGS